MSCSLCGGYRHIVRDECADYLCSDVRQIVEPCACNRPAADADASGWEPANEDGLLDWQEIPELFNQSYPEIDYDAA